MSYTRGPLPRYWHSIDTVARGPVPPQSLASSSAWPTASLAIYVPVAVERRVIVKKLWYANSSGAATGNYDIGLYDSAGTALLRKGSTAKTATDTEIVWDCTDTVIGPGIYYLALASNSSTDTFPRWAPAAPTPAALGVHSEAVFALPAAATFAVAQTLAYVPILGMFLDTRVS